MAVLPFRPKTSRRGDYNFAELIVTLGPAVIGGSAPDGAALLARVWAVELRADNTLRAYQRQPDGSWTRITADLPPVFGSTLPASTRRLTATFDQTARLLIAYEDAGVIKVTRWDANSGEYVQNVSFAGVDPTLLIDTAWTGRVPDSDVLLFYLSTDRETVCCRVQRETYGTEREMHAYSEPVVLDRVIAGPYRYELLVSDAAGDPLEHVLVSGLYPLASTVGVQVSGAFVGGESVEIGVEVAREYGVELSGRFAGGELAIPGALYSPSLGVQVSGAFTGGELVELVTVYSPSLGVQVSGAFTGGELAEIGVEVARGYGVELTGQFIGGSYVEP